jgi:hypothetical protein
MTSSTPITRVTLLKIPDEKHQGIALAGFETFTKNQKKVRFVYSFPFRKTFAFSCPSLGSLLPISAQPSHQE